MLYPNKTVLIVYKKSTINGYFPVSILYKSIAGRYRPVRVGDGPITARYRFIKNASWVFYIIYIFVVIYIDYIEKKTINGLFSI